MALCTGLTGIGLTGEIASQSSAPDQIFRLFFMKLCIFMRRGEPFHIQTKHPARLSGRSLLCKLHRSENQSRKNTERKSTKKRCREQKREEKREYKSAKSKSNIKVNWLLKMILVKSNIDLTSQGRVLETEN